MTKRAILIKEVEQVPDQYIGELLDFVRFLKIKKIKSGVETAVASESSLKKDWLKAEEDAAWQNL